MFGLLVSRKIRVLTICHNKPFRVTVNCGKSFPKIRKPVKQDSAYHLQLFSADERLESGEFKKRLGNFYCSIQAEKEDYHL